MGNSYYNFHNRGSEYVIFGIVILISIVSVVTTSLPANASSDAYEAGYDHGCHDADFRYPGDRYINQPGNGPSQHSDEFMSGYEDGFNACNDNGYQITTNFPELEEGERYGTCEQKSNIGLVCDIEDDR
ncbi:MAG: hypothetical protein WA941_08715 [Nitrososphaeraceae archaeon]